ncbi:FAD/NAD(P)-binding domain-containing protein [Xylariaceae sp. FL0804]|nr:FAD/NAD(P)-binding domain-containing protein [Xylariaceae sp. FL0804]
MATNGHTNGGTARPKTGIKVVIVGAGFGGLGAAIECHRQGHDVEIYEAFPELKALGDIISFGPNAGRIFHRWAGGEVARRMRALSIDLRKYGFNIHKYDTGEVVINQKTPEHNVEAPNFNGHRGELHEVVFNYAKDELGVPIHLGQKIKTYFEDEKQAGIVLDNGEKVTADVVIAADGVRSRARKAVLGYEDKPKSSGYAVWRAWFSNKDMLADPETAQFCENGDTFNGWIGPDMHFLFSTIKDGSDCCWVLTHPDEHDIDESWSFPGKLSEVLAAVRDWDPLCSRIISKTPEAALVDWKLVYRDPLPTWVAPSGRVLLLGDAAHPFLPTSAQGATQALEDGVCIAVCLRRAAADSGSEGVPEAVRAHERIRYERVRAVQKTGETTRDMWHKTDWAKVREDPTVIQFPREDWIFDFDAEKNAEETYDDVVKELAAAKAKAMDTNTATDAADTTTEAKTEVPTAATTEATTEAQT